MDRQLRTHAPVEIKSAAELLRQDFTDLIENTTGKLSAAEVEKAKEEVNELLDQVVKLQRSRQKSEN